MRDEATIRAMLESERRMYDGFPSKGSVAARACIERIRVLEFILSEPSPAPMHSEKRKGKRNGNGASE